MTNLEAHALSRVAKFVGVDLSGIRSIIKLEGDSFYKIYLTSGSDFLTIEIMNKQIVSLFSNGKEGYSVAIINDEIVSDFGKSNVTINIEYFDSFTALLEDGKNIPEENAVRSKENIIVYNTPIYANNTTIEEANINEVVLNTLNVNSIKFGEWNFKVSNNIISLTFGEQDGQEAIL